MPELFIAWIQKREKFIGHMTPLVGYGVRTLAVAAGKVLLGNEDGDLIILDHGKQEPKVKTVNMGAPVYSSPVVSNGTLLYCYATHLYAIGK